MTRESSKKAAETMLARDPDHFKKIGKSGNTKRKVRFSYYRLLKETDPEKLKEISKRGGLK